jgi:hypothetical protein
MDPLEQVSALLAVQTSLLNIVNSNVSPEVHNKAEALLLKNMTKLELLVG